MNILYVGDVMGEPGIRVLQRVLPGLRRERKIDLVIAQAENTSEGKGLTLTDYRALRDCGVDFCTGGNWSLHRDEIVPLLSDPNQPVIRPENYPVGTPGRGYKYINTPAGKVLVISLLGQILGRDADKPMRNPLQCIDEILEQEKTVDRVATVVNFHGDYSSEKRVIGYYLDGRVTAVIGDHWHVPTADAMVLPKGTAHITDVGMCGSLDSSLGVQLDVIVRRWRTGQQSRNMLERTGRMQFNAVCIELGDAGLAKNITPVQLYYDA